MIKSFLALLFLASISQTSLGAQQGNEPFMVTIKGKESFIKNYQKRAELKMARSTDFCRGFYMPKKISAWQCKAQPGSKRRCQAKYMCDHIKKSFSRVSETRRLRKELRQTRRTATSFTMIVNKHPLKNPSKYKYVAQIEREREKYRQEQKRKVRSQVLKRTEKLKEQMTEYDEFAQLEKELAIETDPMSPQQRKGQIDELSSGSLEEDRRQLNASQEDEAPFRMERIKSNTGNGEVIKITRKTEEEVPEDKKFEIFSFSGAMARVQDDNANSVATADIAWTPRWRFSPKWSFRGRLGGHFISAEIIAGDDPETFLVYDLGGSMEWFPFAESFYLTGGLGIQSWTSTTGGAFTTVSLGGGYLFDFNKVKVVDRIFLDYTTVGNDASNTELKVGIGVTF